MTLITLFSAPKAFSDPVTARAQRNAIGSWKRLSDADMLLLGREEGLEAAAREMGVRQDGSVALNPNGVPLISSMLQLARATCSSPLLCIINADIVLTSDFMDAIRQVAALQASAGTPRPFTLLSRRWDLDITDALDFTEGWQERIRLAARERGKLHRPTGSDFFVFPRDCYTDVPDFAIGRAGWDNWMIYRARKAGWPVIDGTPSMTIIHQNHDYRHLPGARPHYDHPDTQRNTALAGGQAATRYTILDSTHTLVNGRLTRPAMSTARFGRGLELLLRRILFFLPENLLETTVRPKRWSKRLKKLLGKSDP